MGSLASSGFQRTPRPITASPMPIAPAAREAMRNTTVERGDAPAQRGEVETDRNERGPDRGKREGHGQHAAVEREHQREGRGRDGGGSERAEADAVGVARPRRAALEEQPRAARERDGE